MSFRLLWLAILLQWLLQSYRHDNNVIYIPSAATRMAARACVIMKINRQVLVTILTMDHIPRTEPLTELIYVKKISSCLFLT